MEATATNDGPVMSLINKRLRALRKKLNRIVAMEESLSQGKPLNKEQEEVLRSKPSVLALIDEFEKLRQPLSTALAEELDLAVQNRSETLPENSSSTERPNSNDDVVQDILNLLYFGSLFDVKSQNDFTSTMLTRTHERGCCLTYDYVTDDATDLLGEKDLDSISALRGLLISRPADSSFSHKNALQHCIEHAKLWLSNAEQPIEPNAGITYAGLREKLNKIMSSEYFTTTPEMKAPVEVAAAAAAGNYGSFQVPVHGSVVPVEVDGSDSQPQEKEEGTANFQGQSGDDQSDPEREFEKDEVEAENAVEVVVQHEQTNSQLDVEYSQPDVEAKEQQYYPRRGYQNQRGGRGGGGRRGYSNGRGGRGGGRGGYQNGRNQYYDQPGNYYPRNYYNNRGRGGRGGGYSYNNYGSGGQVNHVAGRNYLPTSDVRECCSWTFCVCLRMVCISVVVLVLAGRKTTAAFLRLIYGPGGAVAIHHGTVTSLRFHLPWNYIMCCVGVEPMHEA
ncbi:putative keratin, type I cytoskeletal 10 [Sesbania bispinosa]|nr:putative keratin, type I cytoskeletal 10 [Sesbania bispinosa]